MASGEVLLDFPWTLVPISTKRNRVSSSPRWRHNLNKRTFGWTLSNIEKFLVHLNLTLFFIGVDSKGLNILAQYETD